MIKFVLLVFMLYCSGCCSSIIKQRSIEEYIRHECQLEEHKSKEYCLVFIHNNLLKNKTSTIFMIFSDSILVMEESEDAFQSQYYHLFGKEISFHVTKDIKNNIIKDIPSIDYQKEYKVEQCLIRISARAEIDNETWKITPI